MDAIFFKDHPEIKSFVGFRALQVLVNEAASSVASNRVGYMIGGWL